MARNAGMDIPGSGQGACSGGAPAGAGVASDPNSSGATFSEGVQALGLKLESRKAVIDQLVVDHLEKTPTELTNCRPCELWESRLEMRPDWQSIGNRPYPDAR